MGLKVTTIRDKTKQATRIYCITQGIQSIFYNTYKWSINFKIVNHSIVHLYCTQWGFPGGSNGKGSTSNVGDLSSVPGLGRSPGGGHGNPVQYFCLENPHGQRSLAEYSLWGRKESDMNEQINTAQSTWTIIHCYFRNFRSFDFFRKPLDLKSVCWVLIQLNHPSLMNFTCYIIFRFSFHLVSCLFICIFISQCVPCKQH